MRFLLQFFFGEFGAADFYVGYKAYGGGKIIFTFSPLIVLLLIGVISCSIDEANEANVRRNRPQPVNQNNNEQALENVQVDRIVNNPSNDQDKLITKYNKKNEEHKKPKFDAIRSRTRRSFGVLR